MAFNPLEERGIPLDQQVRNWSELNVDPWRSLDIDPYTATRVITMNGLEIESILFMHQLARHTDDYHLKAKLAELRELSQQQQKCVNWLIPATETTLEVTLRYEQVAVDLTAWIARMEPDPYLKQTYEFGLLEDFDHLYRYANLYELMEHKKAEDVISRMTEIMPGRPTVAEHRFPADNVRKHYDKHTADPLSQLHALTVTSAEQQTMNFYMNIGNRYMEPIARSLYQEIGQIEEEHVTQYESMLDPASGWFEQLAYHMYNECYMYYSFREQETDDRIRAIWDLHLAMEIGHLRVACDLMREHTGREAAEILPKHMPDPVRFESNKAFIRSVMAENTDLTSFGTGYVRDAHERYQSFQNAVNDHGSGAPSERVIERARDELGHDYRVETEGPHPVERLRVPSRR